jgi:hypothetical protein
VKIRLDDAIIIFVSVHQTFRAEEELGRTDYIFSVVPVPPYVQEGCGLGIKVRTINIEEIKCFLINKGIEIMKTVKL